MISFTFVLSLHFVFLFKLILLNCCTLIPSSDSLAPNAVSNHRDKHQHIEQPLHGCNTSGSISSVLNWQILDFNATKLTRIFSLWAKLIAIWVVWQRMSISTGYVSEIPWVKKRMGYLFCLWRTLREAREQILRSHPAPLVKQNVFQVH